MNNSWVPYPIPYQGSKRRLAAAIAAFFPPRFQRLVEPFAGSAAISLYTAAHGLATRFLLNDLNEPLVGLWREILVSPDKLSSNYRILWEKQRGRERAFYYRARDAFNRTGNPALFLYLLSRCVKAAVRYNSKGEFNQSPDNRRLGRRPQTMKKHIHAASQLLSGKTALYSMDYADVLSLTTRHDLVYLDPPYHGLSSSRGNNRYLGSFDHERFIGHMIDLSRRGYLLIISYDGRRTRPGLSDAVFEIHRELILEGFVRYELHAGRSAQSTLLGKEEYTYESVYLSSALAEAAIAPPLFEQAFTRG